MVFSSIVFLIYFLPIFLGLYYLTDKKYKNYIVLIASVLFYSWGAPVFVFVVIGSVILDFYIINKLWRSTDEKVRKWLLTLSISINVGLLLYFKYANFFVDNVNGLLSQIGIEPIGWTAVMLPIGISFYTFQTLTYSIDVYRKVRKPLRNPVDYLVYILLFPQMIAGPIVRFNLIADQIEDREKYETVDNKLLGLFRFAIGLAKKVLIANTMGAFADRIFAYSYDDLTTPMVWIGIVAYAFQIYYDFSGYSDMAIGIGKMIGFTFPENFNNPYISRNITEFWRRWHMTLGGWMRDYLYIPLGGSKVKSRSRLYFNLWIVFLISGLWHGAAWNFVLWGAFHGFFLILDRLFLIRLLEKIGKFPSIIFTFFVTLIGWILFRANSWDQIVWMVKKMFAFDFEPSKMIITTDFWVMLVIGFIFSVFTLFSFGRKIENLVYYKETYSVKGYTFSTILTALLIVLAISSISSSGFNPFIYFRF